MTPRLFAQSRGHAYCCAATLTGMTPREMLLDAAARLSSASQLLSTAGDTEEQLEVIRLAEDAQKDVSQALDHLRRI